MNHLGYMTVCEHCDRPYTADHATCDHCDTPSSLPYRLVNVMKERDALRSALDKLTASEALYGFCGWLTSRAEKTVMSSTDDAGCVAGLVAEFCKANNLQNPRDGWDGNLVHPKETP
jgi:hypothetical protein